jgi:NAD+ synthase
MEYQQLADGLVSWIGEQVTRAGCRGLVLGMSGGVDSSVLAVLCQRAFPQNTLGVLMPCHSQPEDKAHALLVAEKFGITTEEVVLDDIYDVLVRTLPDRSVGKGEQRLARANLKPRLRMVTLYSLANQLRYVVAGSSNRSEITVGYFTKYGDGGVDIMPLGNLVKAQVRELARSLQIPAEIIDKPPSAGLWQGQTDEQEMGLSYDELDRYILTGEAPAQVQAKIESMNAASAHKRSLPPIPVFKPLAISFPPGE